METYKGRRVLHATERPALVQSTVIHPEVRAVGSRAGQTIALIGKTKARENAEALVEVFLHKGGKIEHVAEKTVKTRKEMVMRVHVLNSVTGKVDFVAAKLPAIDRPIVAKMRYGARYEPPKGKVRNDGGH